MMDIKPTKYDCTCGRCGATFPLISAIGPSDICRACANWIFIAVIFGRA